MPIYQAMESIPQMGDLQLPFDDTVKKLEGLVGFNLKFDQQRAPKELHIGSDLCLGASLGTPYTLRMRRWWRRWRAATYIKINIILINIYLVGVARYAEVDLQPLKKD
jgi:hypothetical protein